MNQSSLCSFLQTIQWDTSVSARPRFLLALKQDMCFCLYSLLSPSSTPVHILAVWFLNTYALKCLLSAFVLLYIHYFKSLVHLAYQAISYNFSLTSLSLLIIYVFYGIPLSDMLILPCQVYFKHLDS